jgi:hypothetical protein
MRWLALAIALAAYYEQSGMDYLTTSFLAWEAFPAVVIAAIAVPVARYLRHGSR